jgi:histidyl-tRNA synthetase
LRVLDCKVDKDSPILAEAPKPLDFLSPEAKAHFDAVVAHLKNMHLDFVVDKSLVRGLDYYTHTVFELEADLPTLGAQATLGGGGRYNDLVETLDGPSFPSVGFAFGLERLLLAMESLEKAEPEDRVHAFLISLGEAAKAKSSEILLSLRHGGLICEADFMDRPLKGQFKQAERVKARYLLIQGDEEIAKGVINVKNAETGVQETVELGQLYQYLVQGIQSLAHHCGGECESCNEDC